MRQTVAPQRGAWVIEANRKRELFGLASASCYAMDMVMRSETVEYHYDTIFGRGGCWLLNTTETKEKFC